MPNILVGGFPTYTFPWNVSETTDQWLELSTDGGRSFF